tara:strand:+ start:216 stop:389 length:174 start_codon:yes stop_codon:yes gene_type:complete
MVKATGEKHMNTPRQQKIVNHFKLKQHIAQLETKYAQQITLLKKLARSIEKQLEEDL